MGPDRIVRALHRAGLVDYRQKGSHLTMLRPETGRNVTVAMRGRVLSVDLIRCILGQAGLTVEEPIEFLK